MEAALYNILLVSCTDQIQTTCSTYMEDFFNGRGNHTAIKDFKVPNTFSYNYRPEKYSGYPKDFFGRVLEELNSSGFYYKGLEPKEAKDLLMKAEPGHFIVRDSSTHENFFTLTYKNQLSEVLHIRIEYSFGMFYLGSSSKTSLSADSVVKLIELLIMKRKQAKNSSNSKKLYVTTPLQKTVPSLQHLCRLSVNKGKCDSRSLPQNVKEYVSNYPFKV